MPNPDWLPKPPKEQPLPLGLIIIFLLIGVTCLAWGAHDLYLAESSKHWAEAPGTILSSDYGSITSNDYDPGRSGNKTRTRTSHLPEISYVYVIGKAVRQGDRIFFGEGFHMSQKAASTLTSRYPTGTKVTIHYDAQHPERSVLEPGIRARNWSGAVVGSIFTLLGWSAWVGRRGVLAREKNDVMVI